MTRHPSLGTQDRVLVVQHPSGRLALRTMLPAGRIVDHDRAENEFHRARKLARVLGKGARVLLGTYLDPKATEFSPAWEEVVA